MSDKNIFEIESTIFFYSIAVGCQWDIYSAVNRCYLVLTDSGGIQEEAPELGKPVLVLRDTTERPEAVGARTVKLVGTARLDLNVDIQKSLL